MKRFMPARTMMVRTCMISVKEPATNVHFGIRVSASPRWLVSRSRAQWKARPPLCLWFCCFLSGKSSGGFSGVS